jgi:hypothetical protein
MYFIERLSTATPDTIRHELLDTVEHLLSKLRRDAEILAELQDACDLLESLPLAADEYHTANNRLRNAHRYLISQERGAARYELQLLAGSLRPRETHPVEPHMRLHGPRTWTRS